MPLKIITADERAAAPSAIKGCIFGPSSIGKTSLLWTLPAESTLCIDAEGGMLSVQGWQGGSIDVEKAAAENNTHPWEIARFIASVLSGPKVGTAEDKPYSVPFHNYAVSMLGQKEDVFGTFKTIFWDSITVFSRYAFSWASQQPESRNKQGVLDTRGIYGLMGKEMVEWLTVIQHIPDKNVWMVGILEQKEDDLGRKHWSPQVEGSKVAREMPGIFDQIISMVEVDYGDPHGKQRAFVCHGTNPFGYPAKDRSRRLLMVEPPHLGALMEKITNAQPNTTLTTTINEG
jgi:hypothetical protein